MIGDAARILNAVRDPGNLHRALQYALRDRLHDAYCDQFEFEGANSNQDRILGELSEELQKPEDYQPRPAYAYLFPKNQFCYRRMIYIPFKDLVVRYAFVSVALDLLDSGLRPCCFANRRARGQSSQERLVEDYATVCWPQFCEWQKECAHQPQYTTLLRTDISAFYDSVSHECLVKAIAGQLAILPESQVMHLFRKILRIPVISYSHHSLEASGPDEMHQGLAIGNGTEGALANLYLKSVDEAMNSLPGVGFGRYVDDMRIFAAGREAARAAGLILQEHLLEKGLNLNGAKTEIAENAAMEQLRSKAYEGGYGILDDDSLEDHQGPVIEDKPFDEFDREFSLGQSFEKGKDASDFCHYLRRGLPIAGRQPGHVDMLMSALTH